VLAARRRDRVDLLGRHREALLGIGVAIDDARDGEADAVTTDEDDVGDLGERRRLGEVERTVAVIRHHHLGQIEGRAVR
jgi:hypothetical protein